MTIALETRTAGTGTGYRRAGLPQAVRAEWTKLLSLRSTKWTLAISAVGAILVTYLSAQHATHHSHGWYQGFDPTNQALAGLAIAPLALGVLGALAMTGEYGTGTIRSTLAAMPRRDTLLAAKVIVVGALTLLVGEVLAFGTFFLGQAILSSGGAPTAALSQSGVLQAVALSGACIALFALLGLGLGVVIRHTGGAIAAFAGITLLWPILIHPISEHLSHFAPAIIFANSVAAVIIQPGNLSPTVGFLWMTVYTLVVLVAGAVVLIRRDA
jgi:hypothetical protein